MKQQSTEEIIKFLEDNVELYPDSTYGQGYRASVTLVVSSKDSLEKYYDFQYSKRVDSVKYETMKRCK